MARIIIPTVEQSPLASKPLLDAVNQQLGIIPNLMKLIGNSPAALEGYLSLNSALGKGVLPLVLRERIALAIAEYNNCEYCLSAHTYIGKNLAKIDGNEIEAARDGLSNDAQMQAALQFALLVASKKGKVSDHDIATLREVNFDDASIVEIVLNVALNILTNYINNVALTDIDFPKVTLKQAA
ncbi:MAG: alkylhydroperoxidase [Methylotenera sp.]|jgi:uncharacterized peroxidase-related enzyme|nr:MAG: alkylhydroperoxidase [Methylotenera sp.]